MVCPRLCRIPRLPIVALVLASSRAAASLAAPWIPVGPTGVGMVTTLAAGRSSVYAATCNGVYRSDDHGSSWHEAGLPRECVVRLAVEPGPDADTLYAIVDSHTFVASHPEPSAMTFPLILGSTLWVSRDGGQSWIQTSVFSSHAIAVDVSHPGTAYVVGYFPLAVTHDSGASWSPVPDAPDTLLNQLAFDPRDGVLYGASSFLSTYSGGAWSSLAIPVYVVAVGSGSDGAVYAAGHDGFCRKTNAAPQWACNVFPGSAPQGIFEVPASGPQPARIFVLTFDGVWSSDDGGATFSRPAPDLGGYMTAAAIDPSGTQVFVGNDAGAFRSSDRGETWTNSSAGLRSMWVRALALDPSDPATVWAGGETRVYDVGPFGPGLFRSTDGGESWTSASVAGEPGYVFSLGIDPSNPQSVYAGSFNLVERTSDGGANWGTDRTINGFIHGLAVDPASSSRVWAAADGGLRRSTNGGATWEIALSQDIFSILFDSRHPETIYAGGAWDDAGSYYPYGTGFAVQTSRDGGSTWQRAASDQEGGVTALAIDPFSADAVYAGTYAGTILRSPDAGATWERWSTQDVGSSIFALAIDPERPGFLYLGTWAGAFRSRDGGRTWEDFSEGLSPYGVFGLAITPDGRWLYAGTTGGGVFRRNLFAAEREPVNQVSRPRETRTIPRP